MQRLRRIFANRPPHSSIFILHSKPPGSPEANMRLRYVTASPLTANRQPPLPTAFFILQFSIFIPNLHVTISPFPVSK